jgi:hypothetical protein
VLAAGRPTFRKARKVGHPRFFSATVKGNPRETYSPEIGATRPHHLWGTASLELRVR